MTDFLLDQMPFLAHMTQFTVVGMVVMALAMLLYVTTLTPEFLLVALTAVVYIAAPHMPHLV